MLENMGGAATVGVAAAIAAFWKQFQAVLYRITGVIFARYEVDGSAALACRHYLLTESKWSLNLGSTSYRSSSAVTTRRRRFEFIAFEMLNESGSLYLCKYGILLATDQHKALDGAMLKMTSFRGFFRVKKFIRESILVYNRSTHEVPKRFCLMKRQGAGSVHSRSMANDTPPSGESGAISANGHQDLSTYETAEALRRGNLQLISHDYDEILETSDLGGGADHDPFHGLFYTEEVLHHVETVGSWIEDKDWYESRSVPWRLGWLLHGSPGTGKTRLVVAIAKKHDMPIVFFDLASMSNEEFEGHWKQAQSLAPCMVVFEDFCRTFKGEKNSIGEEGGGLALTTILNCLSGGETAHGIFTVITVNSTDNLDPAIGLPTETKGSSRPGRMDKALKLDKIQLAERSKLVSFMLEGMPSKLMDKVMSRTMDMTAAQVANVCVDVAREWRKKQNEQSVEVGGVEEPSDREDSTSLTTVG